MDLSKNLTTVEQKLWLVWGSCCRCLLPSSFKLGKGRFYKLIPDSRTHLFLLIYRIVLCIMLTSLLKFLRKK